MPEIGVMAIAIKPEQLHIPIDHRFPEHPQVSPQQSISPHHNPSAHYGKSCPDHTQVLNPVESKLHR